MTISPSRPATATIPPGHHAWQSRRPTAGCQGSETIGPVPAMRAVGQLVAQTAVEPRRGVVETLNVACWRRHCTIGSERAVPIRVAPATTIAEMRRKVLSNAGRRQPQMLTDCRDRFSRLLARAVVQIASGDRDEVNKPPPRYPVTSGSALVGVWSEARHRCVIVGQAIIREAASKMELEANVRRTTAQRTAQSDRSTADL